VKTGEMKGFCIKDNGDPVIWKGISCRMCKYANHYCFKLQFMCSWHSEQLTMSVSLSVYLHGSTQKLLERSDEVLCGHYTIGIYPKIIYFSFLQLVMPT
jgi:hypothetical protein